MNLYDLMLIVPAVLTAYVISYISMPAIIRIAELKEFVDSPDGSRKIHQRFVPTMGGVGIFTAFIISYLVWGQVVALESFPFFIAALLILFFMGVRDDIVELTPIKKLIIQITAATILVIGGGVSLGSFSGLLGLGDLSPVQGSIASVIILVAIINAYNLIDGIDGLAGGVGVIASGILGIWFWGAGFLSLAILSFSLSGSLIGFLAFNMFPARLFMGDTGAMSIGFILGYLSLEFLILNHTLVFQPWHIINGEILAISVLIIPIVDTLRVIMLRLKKGVSPFKADKSHIHHEILGLGISHLHSAFLLWLVNIFIIGVAYMTMPLNINIQLIVVISVGFTFLPMLKFVYRAGDKLFNINSSKDSSDSPKTAYEIK